MQKTGENKSDEEEMEGWQSGKLSDHISAMSEQLSEANLLQSDIEARLLVAQTVLSKRPGFEKMALKIDSPEHNRKHEAEQEMEPPKSPLARLQAMAH